MPDDPAPEEIDRWHRWMAASLFNRAWDLLESGRTPEEDRELLATALASWLHWRQVGTPVNRAVADWQVARVWAVLGDAAAAEAHGLESLRVAEEAALGPFFVGYACEALARAAGVAGDSTAREAWRERAARAAAEVADEGDRALLEADLEAL
jgi:hypothetical protein